MHGAHQHAVNPGAQAVPVFVPGIVAEVTLKISGRVPKYLIPESQSGGAIFRLDCPVKRFHRGQYPVDEERSWLSSPFCPPVPARSTCDWYERTKARVGVWECGGVEVRRGATGRDQLPLIDSSVQVVNRSIQETRESHALAGQAIITVKRSVALRRGQPALRLAPPQYSHTSIPFSIPCLCASLRAA